MLLLLLFISPIIAVLLSLQIKRQRKIVESIFVASVIIQFLSCMAIINSVINNRIYSFTQLLTVGAFEAFVLGITVVVGLIATLHSVGYLRGEQEKGMIGFTRVKECYILMNLFLLCMYLAITTTNPIIMWIAIEATTLSTVFLISFFNRKADIEAAWKYLIINSVGLLLGLLGTILFIAQASSHDNLVNWNSFSTSLDQLDPLIGKIAFVFILVGYGTKMGLVPMHTWKPDAYNKAPLPVVSLLSGALLNVALLAILRFKIIIDSVVGVTFSQTLFIFIGIMSIVLAALIIFTQNNYKRLLAYSSIEHAGIMMLGFGFGGIGVFGAILHMAYHAFAKSLLFLVSSNIALRYSSSKISDVSGMLKSMPHTTVLFVIGILTIVGIPPFGIFFSEFYILLSAFNNHPLIAVLVILSLAIVLTGFFKQGFSMIFGAVPSNIKIGETDMWRLVPIALLALLLVIAGLFIPDPILDLVKESVRLFTPKI